ncbi:ABC transporter permease [Acidicapsa dinghuensis]|uniref:ABC transporter permease n=1 Tax=Acidicapsa dinghuensis TaxID=2218256 RepID=A0ABW1EL74_9BACT|nr:ABC transporter permease [Acidicapsa dinghuensis]
MHNLLRDIHHALRRLRKSPGFSLTAILTLAFGIGATTAIFSIVEGVLLRPLPFPGQSSLVTLADIIEGVDYGGDAPGVTAPGVRTYMRDTSSFSGLGGYQPSTYELSGVGDPAQINATRLTASVFPTLGISPLLGRTFTQQEDESSVPVTVISYQLWHSRFHGDTHILGQKLLLDRKPYEIVGVMPAEFEFPLIPGQLNQSELWILMSFTHDEAVLGAGSWGFYMVGRLKPGITIPAAQHDAANAAQEIMRNFPPALSRRRINPLIQRLDEATVAQARPMVRTLFFAVLVVLFIACVNLAGLLLVRVIGRRREIAVQLALGARGATILRQSLVETITLSVSGGLLGLFLAWVALRAGVSFLPETLPRVSSIGLDGKVVAFALGLALLTGILCGLIPAFAAKRTAVNESLKEGGRTGSAGGAHARLRSILVIAELAVALVLLTASGLLLRSFQKIRSINLGFRSDHMLTASYNLPRQRYTTQASIDTFNAMLQSKLEQLPGVEAAGVTTLLPAANQNVRTTFTPEGYVPPKGAGLNVAWYPEVMGDYFHAAGIPILRGRAFTTADNATAPLVVIVNRALAEHYWPGQEPIGKRLHRGSSEATNMPWLTIVGEIGEVKELAADVPTMNQVYFPSSQMKASGGPYATAAMLTGSGGSIVLRSQQPPDQLADALRDVIRSLDSQLPVTHVESMDHVVSEGQASRRFTTALISAFAGAAVLLALLGIYSVIAFTTAQRTQEMAIRLALGSQRGDVMQLILFSGARLGVAGCVLGAVATVFATRLLRSFLFQIDPLDPMVIALAAFSILILALAASLLPARRAAHIDPIQALRAE